MQKAKSSECVCVCVGGGHCSQIRVPLQVPRLVEGPARAPPPTPAARRREGCRGLGALSSPARGRGDGSGRGS